MAIGPRDNAAWIRKGRPGAGQTGWVAEIRLPTRSIAQPRCPPRETRLRAAPIANQAWGVESAGGAVPLRVHQLCCEE